jgi:hypothetical protein
MLIRTLISIIKGDGYRLSESKSTSFPKTRQNLVRVSSDEEVGEAFVPNIEASAQHRLAR